MRLQLPCVSGGNDLGVTQVILFQQVREGLKWENLGLDLDMSLTIAIKAKETCRQYC